MVVVVGNVVVIVEVAVKDDVGEIVVTRVSRVSRIVRNNLFNTLPYQLSISYWSYDPKWDVIKILNKYTTNQTLYRIVKGLF